VTPALDPDEVSPEAALWTRPIWRDPRALRDVEMGVVVDVLRRRARAAEMLHVKPTTLHEMMKRLNISVDAVVAQ
jgi:transcriptional regulator with GAF, ATPase, and Fis domain